MHENKKMAIVRLIILAGMILNAVLAHYGKNPIPMAEEQVYQIVSDVILIAQTFYVAYRNNDVTDEGVKGTAVTRKLKNKPMTQAEFDKYLEAKKELSDVQ